jgi:transposase
LAVRDVELHPNDEPKVNPNGIEELVTDKGYHSGAVLTSVESCEVRSYIPEKKQRGRRHWQDKSEEQKAVYANRRRVRGGYGKKLLKRRGEFVERSFAHCYETGGMRRTTLRGHGNMLKRQLIHVGAFNLSLVMRKLLGAGTPREPRNRFGARILCFILQLVRPFGRFVLRVTQYRLPQALNSAEAPKYPRRSRLQLRRLSC